MDKLNNSKRAIKGTITKIETFVEESGKHTPTKFDIKLKRVKEMNRKIDELKDQYYDIKDISESETTRQSMEDRLEELEGVSINLRKKSYCGLAINAEINSNSLNQQLQAFWEIERVDESSIEHSLEEEICETQNKNTHYRTEEGRYVVQLPLKKDPYCLEWDEPLSNPIAKEWKDFVSTLPVIQNIHVPRLVIGKGRIIIHGFADASTAAYGAVLYAQSISEKDVSTRLLCSKYRVAPVKPITISRLELCACVLLSQLLEKVLHSLTLPIQQIMLWTDSNIVLAWIQRSPEQLKTFIGNRIKIIQRLTQNCQWNHVSSNENPADLISRGLNASDISSKQLWWHGPDF
ncbi:integrase catalytic domain-containing protein [Trichonephila clavipes]|nr:integrase catalytic domain-containing protein [Trichonephila clavipes]